MATTIPEAQFSEGLIFEEFLKHAQKATFRLDVNKTHYATAVHIGNGNLLTVDHALPTEEQWAGDRKKMNLSVFQSRRGPKYPIKEVHQFGYSGLDVALLKTPLPADTPHVELGKNKTEENLFTTYRYEGKYQNEAGQIIHRKLEYEDARYAVMNPHLFLLGLNSQLLIDIPSASGAGIFNTSGKLTGLVVKRGYVESSTLSFDAVIGLDFQALSIV